MIIELDVYSGRPNPNWTLSKSEAQIVNGMIEGLPVVSADPQPGLGYRGFIISSVGAHSKKITVGNGFVSIANEGGATLHYRDNTGLERRLIDGAVAHGYGELLKSLGVSK